MGSGNLDAAAAGGGLKAEFSMEKSASKLGGGSGNTETHSESGKSVI